MPIKYLRVGWGRYIFQTQYPMWNCSWIPWKWKIISVMDTNIKYKKSRMEEGITPIKSLRARWRKDTFQAQYPMWNCSWLPRKWQVISAMDNNMKCKNARMEEEKMPMKSLQAGWRGHRFQTQYPMWNYKMPIKCYLQNRYVSGGGKKYYMQTQNCSCSKLQWKRNNFLNCQKSKQHET